MVQVLNPPRPAIPAALNPPPDPDQGVIEEARRRQKRRRAAGIAAVVGAAMIAALGWAIGGGGHNRGSGGGSHSSALPSFSVRHGRVYVDGRRALMGVTMSLQAGNVGICTRLISGGGCNGPPPSANYPIWAQEEGAPPTAGSGSSGHIYALFVGPAVAALRVAHVGTFAAESAPNLPTGARQVVFYRPPDKPGSVLAPGASSREVARIEHDRGAPALTETLLDASGRPIAVGKQPPMFKLPDSYWQAPTAAPSSGRCALNSALAGVRPAWGEAATRIAGDPADAAPAWLSCLDEWFSVKGAAGLTAGASFQAAVLLNGRAPGTAPAMLWQAVPVVGHPGIVQVPAEQQAVHVQFPPLTSARLARELSQLTREVGHTQAVRQQDQVVRFQRAAEARYGKSRTLWSVFVPPTVARRVGPAWVVVRYGDSLAERIAFLESLHLTRLDLQRQ
jgi:hypothetical protein